MTVLTEMSHVNHVEGVSEEPLALQVAAAEAPPEWTLDQIAGLAFGVRTQYLLKRCLIPSACCPKCSPWKRRRCLWLATSCRRRLTKPLRAGRERSWGYAPSVEVLMT